MLCNSLIHPSGVPPPNGETSVSYTYYPIQLTDTLLAFLHAKSYSKFRKKLHDMKKNFLHCGYFQIFTGRCVSNATQY